MLADTFRIHNRINLYLLAAIAPESLDDGATMKGRTVGETFAHLHNVRLMWIKAAAPELLDGLEKIERERAHDPALLAEALERSGEAIATLLDNAAAAGGRVKGFKPHATAFLGYLIAHEAHHRGQIALRLKAAGTPLDRKTSYGMWEWGSR
ncbi:MAG TPA: DinB family protein [Candidatus Kapabacteria bacterium]|nr:DinB family protein [Candidatus Kapabacteria bacterium]